MPQQLNKKIVIAGGSGFVGTSLTQHFIECGCDVTVLSRSKPMQAPSNSKLKWQTWDARTVGDWGNCLEGADAIVNLVGRSVNCIKTPENQDLILRSRVESTLALGQAMRTIANPPNVWVQMSTAHWYGDPPQIICTESSPIGYGFAPNIAVAWEDAFHRSKLATQRGVILRTSFVLGRDRGVGNSALGTLSRLAKLGLGGKVASGTQGLSWIHERDLNRLFEFAMCNSQVQGIYIASAPNPVSQSDFMRELRSVLRIPIGLPATEWMVRIGARWILRTDPELALYGRYVVSERLEMEGFSFEFPNINTALRELL
jgi:uncharacterized protein (TIGR01777 family)